MSGEKLGQPNLGLMLEQQYCHKGWGSHLEETHSKGEVMVTDNSNDYGRLYFFKDCRIYVLTMGWTLLPPREGSMFLPFNLGRGLDHSHLYGTAVLMPCALGPGHKRYTTSWLFPLRILVLGTQLLYYKEIQISPCGETTRKETEAPSCQPTSTFRYVSE